MRGELARKFARELALCREESGHNRLSVEHFSHEESERRGEEFFVHNTSLLKYEKGGWPSPPKLLTLARAYGVPLTRFFKAIGAEDSEVCGHIVRPEDARLFELLRDPANAELHSKLQALVEAEGEEARAAVAVIEMAVSRVAPQAPGRQRKASQRVYLELPFFDGRVPSGPPATWDPDGLRRAPSPVSSRRQDLYLLRVAGDSMAPELQQEDLVLVDYRREAVSGDIVCALWKGESLLRQLSRRGRGVVLRAFNQSCPDIRVKAKDNLQMQGVVLRVVERDLTRR